MTTRSPTREEAIARLTRHLLDTYFENADRVTDGVLKVLARQIIALRSEKEDGDLLHMAALGRACEAHGLGWYEASGEMRFQPPAEAIIAHHAETQTGLQHEITAAWAELGYDPGDYPDLAAGIRDRWSEDALRSEREGREDRASIQACSHSLEGIPDCRPQAQEGGGWRPIESAPMDGTVFMVWAPGFKWPEVVMWEQFSPEDAAEAGEPGYWRYAEELLAEVTDSASYEDWTNWRPLPAPPADTALSAPQQSEGEKTDGR